MISNYCLYHYSRYPHDTIMSANARVAHQVPGATIRDPRTADDLYFFFDPVPLARIAAMKFPHEHPTWAPGTVLWEHSVLLSKIPHPSDVRFTVMESPKLTELADQYWKKVPNPVYQAMEDRVHVTDRTRGRGLAGLSRVCYRFHGTTEAAFERWFARPDFAEMRLYYAATVPHLKLVVAGGVVPVTFKIRRQVE